ncbi:hypothetical protein [Desulfosporosinus sp. BICA1-9]|uniref:hypothetical protein n=1 Tax=Desulfosporosinus sp. BICA1-9 TaxID=1531958 RepID=UPI00054C6B43|nr:hypothetical protein [Desulfosporosinus sp. BICA1-9]KJS47028.1 MAG: hypothetical protein VR66_21995 [Peptococcaceae bacterium BRH_c23]KJS87114.1 MAG: hypothetical protein JL57_14850 [Desulfosporosinus sp. BICA1-9]HBW37366.1 hypothetical protein [Desulfosporosinus sp.]
MPISKEEMIAETEAFWKGYPRGTNYVEYYSNYIHELLPYELDYIRQSRETLKINVGTLVFIVGYSLEPLILLICLIKPPRVLIVLNENYGRETGEDRAPRVKGIIQKAVKEVSVADEEMDGNSYTVEMKHGILSGEGPNEVYEFLHSHCKGCKDLIIDVTGGKKSMVSGAFLYAAYNNTRITYVDFYKYDEQGQRPYGFSCYPDMLKNPIKEYALKDWARVQDLYEKYSFPAALEILQQNILKSSRLEGSRKFDPDEINKLNNLKSILEMYKFWDMSDFKTARISYKKIANLIGREMVPNLIFDIEQWQLGGQSIEEMVLLLKKGDTDIIERFGKRLDRQILSNPKLVALYVQNEINKAQILISDYSDYRSSFLKTSAVSEFLIKSRVYRYEKHLQPRELIDSFLGYGGLSLFITLLDHGVAANIQYNYTFDVLFFDILRNRMGDEFVSYQRMLQDAKNLSLFRNKTVHGVLPIPKEMATESLRIAKNNLQNYLKYFLPQEDRSYVDNAVKEIIPWNSLKQALQLDFIPEDVNSID